MQGRGKVAVAGAPVWFIGWLFTIGLARLNFVEGVLAIIIWPYFLGVALR